MSGGNSLENYKDSSGGHEECDEGINRVLATISLSFDASLGEIFRSLGSGATLCLGRREELLPGPDLIRILQERRIDTVTLSTAVLAAMPRDVELPKLTTLSVGGEALSTELAACWAPGRRLLNGYGPTETAIGATLATEWPLDRKPPLGRPLSNVRAYVCDSQMRLNPIGVPGELFLGGPGVARGYLDRPDQTAERFVPDPFGDEPGARLYRTGDRVRWRPDGQLEFIGRVDEQVKIRGYRIEPGEIESVLRQHPRVHEAAVLAHRDGRGEHRLIAYVVGTKDAFDQDMVSAELVADWQQASEGAAESVKAAVISDPLMNFSGWISSYNDQPIPLEEMQAWADSTVERIAAAHPAKVLEIGCGTGLILLRLAPRCYRYVGVDFSAGLVEYTRGQLDLISGSGCITEVHQRLADDLGDWSDQSFDGVVLNSVAQYFPNVDYLLRVVREALRLVRPGGMIFLGDIRNLKLLETFHASVQYHKAASQLTVRRLGHMTRRSMSLERELVLDPQFFVELARREPRLTHVQILPKGGAAHNELSKFRYDVMLHVEGSAPQDPQCKWLNWYWETPKDGLAALRVSLQSGTSRLGLRGIPNARTKVDAQLAAALHDRPDLQTVADLRRELAHAAPGVELEELRRLGEELGYEVEFSWLNCDEEGRIEALFLRPGDTAAMRFPVAAEGAFERAWQEYANSPAQAAKERMLAGDLRDYLGGQLPDYMVPSGFVVLDALPLTVRGKLDRQALPTPEGTEERPDLGTGYVAPEADTEKVLANIWADLLELDRVGVHDNFFDLGGHSLLATQFIARLQTELGVSMPITVFFTKPTVAEVVAWIGECQEGGAQQGGPSLRAAKPSPDGRREAPQSFAQQRLWFMAQLAQGVALYNSLGTIPLMGELNLEALQQTLTELVRRHESLRTTFASRDGEPIQCIHPLAPITLKPIDLRHLPPMERQAELRRLRQGETSRPFDLVRGPVARFTLVLLDAQRQVLMISMHHIITDGWSMGILRREFSVIYAAFSEGLPSPLPEPVFQYADFATWQRQWLSGAVLDEQLGYWKRQLAGIENLELPTERPRPKAPRYQSAYLRFMVDPETTDRLYDLGRGEEATLFMVLLAAFQLMVGRYAGFDDVAVGTPIANRTRAELEGLIGFFVNTLVIRTDLSKSTSFLQLLRQVRQTCLEAYAHQDLPFERLVEELAPERHLGIQPLFQVMFVLQNTPDSGDATGFGQPSQGRQQDGGGQGGGFGAARFDLVLQIKETPEGLEGILETDIDLFAPETGSRFASYFHELLKQVVAWPEGPISGLTGLGTDAREQVLLQALGSVGDFEYEVCANVLFEAQAERTPDAPAIWFAGEALSYAHLNRAANRLAHHLRALGVGPEVLVGICMERSTELIVAILGVLKSGGAYVPLDPAYPEERIAFIIQDTGMAVVLTDRRSHSAEEQTSFPVDIQELVAAVDPRPILVDLGVAGAQIAERASSNPPQAALPGNLAYVIYTSGSTGKPKGVLLQHRGLANLTQGQIKVFDISAESRILQFASYSFDASVSEIFTALASGATLYLARREKLLSPPELLTFLRDHRITTVTLPPSLLAVLPAEELPALRTIVSAGESCSWEIAQRWREGRRFLNAYGPTEATVGPTCYVLDDSVAGDLSTETRSVPIGRPLPHYQAYVLDGQQQPVPAGFPGELYLGGPGLARGYLARPEMTADRFIPHPFSTEPGARLYRTGDRVRWLSTGQLEFLGRVDEQVKIRGFRIEPEEVATVLRQHPQVRSAAVVPYQDQRGESRLIAYVVSARKETEFVSAGDELVADWQQGGEDVAALARSSELADPRMNFSGWNSSYTDEPIPFEEMRDWADATVERILASKPAEVFEIGCGMGLILYRLAPHCKRYVGVDLAQGLVDVARSHLSLIAGSDCEVELMQRRADDLSDWQDHSFDCVILNSVVQYFPDVNYLVGVLREAVRLVRPRGMVFVGDVRSRPLLDAFHASVQFSKAAANFPSRRLAHQARRFCALERELVIDPRLFVQFKAEEARLSHIQVMPKFGAAKNELIKFRYDVVLHVEGEVPSQAHGEWLAWRWESAVSGIDALRGMLARHPAHLAVRGVPNARTAGDGTLVTLLESRPELQTVADLRKELARQEPGVEPDALWALADELGYSVELSWIRGDVEGRFDMLFRPRQASGPISFPAASESTGEGAWERFANSPAQAAQERTLALTLRNFLGRQLPDYMVPSTFVLLDALPLTVHGKLDRRALPAPAVAEERPDIGGQYVAPNAEIEKKLAEIWMDLLELQQVGIHDNFFDLGGHSLLATQVIARLHAELGVAIPVSVFFSQPTVAELAAWIEERLSTPTVDDSPPLEAIPPEADGSREAPASFAQYRLWFVEQLAPGSALYNTQAAISLRGELDPAALERALTELVRRHESLRTTFVSREGELFQRVAPPSLITLAPIDLRGKSPAERQGEMRRLMQTENLRAFDLARGPLVRFTLALLEQHRQILVMALHHIITDGWSMGILRREIQALYHAFRSGQPSPLPEPRLQYANFAAWQRLWLSQAVLDRQLDYWREKLGGVEMLELPTDRPRPKIPRYRSARHTFIVAPELADRLRDLGRKEEATLFMVLLTAFQLLLGRYSGQDDVVVGTPIANRLRAELEDVVGFFVNTLVMRADLGGDPTFRQLLGQVRQTCLEAYAHQDLPFERLVEELAPERHVGVQPLFQVMFVMQNLPQIGDTSGPPRIIDQRSGGNGEFGTAKFDLMLQVTERDQGLQCDLAYDIDLFDGATAERLAGHFNTLLEAIVADPMQPVAKLSLLTEAELTTLLETWNATEHDYPRELCFFHLFERQVVLSPDAVALVFEDTQLTYAALNARANQLAGCLRRLGLVPDDLVGLCVERSPDLVVALLAILKAGAAYVPLDPNYPSDRIGYMLDDSRSRLLVTQTNLLDRLPAGDMDVLCMDREWPEIGQEPDGDLAPVATASNLAYVIYTSGSTGRAKGVEIPHGALVNFLWSMKENLGDAAKGVLLSVTTISFDIAGLELYLPLICGGRIELASRVVSSDGVLLRKYLEELRPDVMQATPVTWRMLIDAGWSGSPQLVALCGGEALPGDLANALVDRTDTLWNMYGPTETTIWSCMRRIQADDRRLPIGRPIANTQVYVLDRQMQPTPIGVAGELYIGGDGLARGYWRRPDITADRFVPDPFSSYPGARLYRTGDRVRYLADGNLDFLGRLDFQIKLRGFRIELGEIESVLAQQPQVHQSVVMLRQDFPGDPRLAAYIVPNGADIDATELRAELKRHLPLYMVPSFFVQVPAMPLTPNGKIDRKALPVPDYGVAEAGITAPSTPVETVVADVWSKVLRIPSVGSNDNFFDLGGHSLLATQVVARLQAELGVAVPIAVFFEQPTVAGVAQWIEANRGTVVDSLPPIRPVPPGPDGRREAPQSFAQQRLWFVSQMAPDSALYNNMAVIALQGPLDQSALELALTELVRRHESLRTTFATRDGDPIQRISAPVPVTYDLVDLRDRSVAERHESMRHLMESETSRPFDLTHGPLVRFTLIVMEERAQILVAGLHHIITDGWSMGILRREFGALYDAFRAGRPSPLPEPMLQYADFAIWQRQWLSGAVLQRQLDYWKERLRGVETLELPTDRPRPKILRYRSGQVPFSLAAGPANRLRELARQEEATLFMVLLSAFQLLLGRYSGQEDITVGSPIANRIRVELETLIGFFVNTLVFRADLAGNPSFREMVRRARRTCLDAYANQDLPFERLVEELAPKRDPSVQPLFQVLFVMQNTPQTGEEAARQRAGSTQTILSEGAGSSFFDLSLMITEADSGLGGTLSFNVDLFDHATAAGMAKRLGLLLEGVAEQPDLRMDGVSILSEAEREQLLVEWTAVPKAGLDRCIHHLFEEQVDRTPEQVALSYGERQYSYQELDRLANQVARLLRARGLHDEDVVGVYLERGPEAIIGLLGILKAGGVYLPLDPGVPEQRLAWFIADSCPALILTQSLLLEGLPEGAKGVICLDGEAEDWPHEEAERLDLGITPSRLAYIIYTSGSTGKPKGVMVEHRCISHTISAQIPLFGLGEGSRVLATIALNFDASLGEIFRVLCSGATLYLAQREVLLPGLDLIRLLKQAQIDTVTLPTAVLAALPRDADLPGLRTLSVGGEALSMDLAAHWGQGRRLLNGYGPTETAIGATLAQDWDPTRRPPLGKPLPGVRAYVLDAYMRLIPVGTPGELYLGGSGLARGYLGQPDQTAARFVPDPFSDQPGARLYRTGDRVLWRTDGQLEFIGRVDQQIKVRGYRIEPEEVEYVLRQHPAVREAVVVTTPQHQLGAYVVPEKEAAVLTSDLREFSRQHLPEYMVPALIMAVSALPLSPNGKIDRRALPPFDAAAAEVEYVAPETRMQQVVAAIWEDVLHCERVGINDNFFELGGHSLLVTQVIARLQAEFGVGIPISTFFAQPTVAAIAIWILGNTGDVDSGNAPPLVAFPPSPDGRREAPQSFAQQRLWFLMQLAPGSALYNTQGVIPFQGIFDHVALDRALTELLRRHEGLRTTFTTRDGEPIQCVAAAAPVHVDPTDLRTLPPGERHAEVRRIRQGDALSPFDLTRGPLVRFRFLLLDDQRQLLLVGMHHIITDGWSMGILRRELAVLYEAFRNGLPSPLPEPKFQYADFAIWQRQWLSGELLQRQLEYWRSNLAGVENLELPTDRPRPKVPAYNSAIRAFPIGAETTGWLREIARHEEATLFMVLLAAFKIVLGRYSGQDDVTVGTPIANRTRTELEGVIGFFVNTLALRTELGGNPSFRQLVRRVRQTCLDAYANQDLPFERLVEELAPQRNPAIQPLFQVLFVFQNTPRSDIAARQRPAGASAVSGANSLEELIYYDLTLMVTENDADLACSLHFNTVLFESDNADGIVRHFRQLVEVVAEEPDLCLDGVSILSNDERERLLVEWNPVDGPRRERCIHHLVEDQADRTPDRIALVFNDERVTYGELERRANQIAHGLRAMGVRPEVPVALFMERGTDAIVGLLAILKAGGIYVPLDPTLPSHRLSWYLNDVKPAFLITHSALMDSVPSCQAVVLAIDDAQSGWEGESDGRPEVEVDPEHLAYIIYTSGSTGRPKGVMVEHRCISHTISTQIPLFFPRGEAANSGCTA